MIAREEILNSGSGGRNRDRKSGVRSSELI